jgi:hypothetical protein
VTAAELAAFAEIHAHAEAGRITLSHHARQRGATRGARFADIRHALITAPGCSAQPNGCWRIDGADTDGDELTVIVAIRHDVLVITVF